MFHGATLDGFEAEMVAGADAVCARLAAADGAPVDVFRLLGEMTMSVVLRTGERGSGGGGGVGARKVRARAFRPVLPASPSLPQPLA